MIHAKVIVMKISNSKKVLARIISENGGWRNGYSFSAQDGDGTGSIGFFKSKPQYYHNSKFWRGVYDPSERIARADVTIKNFHQAILSREEYFNLYPSPDADGWIEWSGGECPVDGDEFVVCKVRSGREWRNGKAIMAKVLRWRHTGGIADIIAYRLHKPEQVETVEYNYSGVVYTGPVKSEFVVDEKPTLEQLATDYRNAKDYAERKQQEADAAKVDAEDKLKALELAGEAIGLLVSPITEKQEPELATVQVGDEVECVESNIKRDKYNGMVGRLRTIDESDTSTPYLVDFGGEEKIWCHKVKFIRRP